MKEKKRFKMPHVFVLLFSIIIVLAICSYIVPAGQFERVTDPKTGRILVDPDSFQYIEKSPIGFFQLFQAVPTGMEEVAQIMIFILIVGGAFSLINATGSIEAGIYKASKVVRGKELLIIPVFVAIFAFLGATIGIAEETLVFIPIGICMARVLGFDTVTGASIVILGSGCGLTAAFMNPFTLGVAQSISELPILSGMWYRIVIWVVVTIVTSLFIMRYAKKVKADPSKGLIADIEEPFSGESEEGIELNKRHVLILAIFLLSLVFLVYAISQFGWYIMEIATYFLILALVCGFIGGMGPSKIAETLIEGAKEVVFGAIIVGLARGILVVMQQGMILDTIIHSLGGLIEGVPPALAGVLMFFVQLVVNFFIPSGSGQAAATMPIMVPLADMIGLSRQTAVLAYQFGDGFTNQIIPTCSWLMVNLAVAKIPYERWVKFVTPIMLIWIGCAVVFLVIAALMNFGPF
ncbi:YfcC family protein [Ihubacter sp. mB4P-1]|uniref:YfcC family protein n=1 Tax=Ihubacter sp. mB4P-1 TaxID=3242370 RepID=UPI003C79F0FE